jgi:hypothetical protein
MLLLLVGGAQAGSHSGVLTKTLGAVTSDAQGVVGTAPLQGTLAKTLASAIGSATGTVLIQGGFSKTLTAIALVATGTVVNADQSGWSDTPSRTVHRDDLIVKDPSSVEVFEYDWDDELPEDAHVATVAVDLSLLAYVFESIADAAALTALEVSDAIVHSDGRDTQATFTGGTLGARYRVTKFATLVDGQVVDGSFDILIQQR